MTSDPAFTVESLVAAHRSELLAFARGRTSSAAEADDLVQQVAERALRHGGMLRDPAAGRAWIFRIARNLLADQRRARRVEVEVSESVLTTEPDDEPAACPCVLARARELKPEYAEVLERVVVEELPIARAAEELGITTNNATVRLHRARAALKKRLADHCGTESLRACADCGCDLHHTCGGAVRAADEAR